MKFNYKSILSMAVGVLFSCSMVQASSDSEDEVVVISPAASFMALVGADAKNSEAYDRLMSTTLADEDFSFEYNDKEAYIGGVYHTGLNEREDFVTLAGNPTIVDHGGYLGVTWGRIFREVTTPMLFRFNYVSLAVEDEDEDEVEVVDEPVDEPIDDL
ncbi:MAG: hypothetical protein GY915_04200 [bacterium]|nr:hypothetical protein [bacterium]